MASSTTSITATHITTTPVAPYAPITARIKKLPPLLINQLSAGEVVTRPASVVKELLENAIDAGATQITINITQGGMGLIELIDNGSGIHPDDMLMAVTRHATSKVADVEHLQGIDTLGFRGEALASISAVSRLTLTSSHDKSGVGRCLSVAGEVDNPNITPVVCQQGTQVSVRDLYFNVPARRGNLKSIPTEYAHIEAVVRQVALVYSDVALTLYHDGKCRLMLLNKQGMVNKQRLNDKQGIDNNNQKISNLHLPPLSRLQQALSLTIDNTPYLLTVDLSSLLSMDKQMNGVQMDSEQMQASIDGWIWLMEENQENKAGPALPRLIYINDRLVTDNAIRQQIRQTMHSLAIDMDRVGYALFFTLPNRWLNLNVHPSKQRISIHSLTNINAHLHNGLQTLLRPIISDLERLQSMQNKQQQQQSMSVKDDVIDHSYLSNQSNKNNQQSEIASPLTVYQSSAIHKNSKVYQLDNLDQSNRIDKEHFQLLLIIKLQNSQYQDIQSQVNKLVQQLKEVLNLSEEDGYVDNDLEGTYRFAIRLDVAQENACKQLIELTDRICTPWLITYQRDCDEVRFTFHKDKQSEFRQPIFADIITGCVKKVL